MQIDAIAAEWYKSTSRSETRGNQGLRGFPRKKASSQADIGTIVYRYTEPREGYEIEFLDKDG